MATPLHTSQPGASRRIISWERLIALLLAPIGWGEEQPGEPAPEDDLADLPPPWYLT